ncbi:MAG: hypothetical protein ACKVW3_02340 [Phycisphaerales bacterium]
MKRPTTPFRAFAIPPLCVGTIISAALIGLGVAEPALRATAVPAGGLGLAICAVGFGLARLIAGRIPANPARELSDLAEAIRAMGEQAALSDDARRVLNRSRERELLRAAIEEDIDTEDWDAALVLVKELAERFGYRADAEEFRQRIEQARYETVQRKVSDAVGRMDTLLVQRRWDQALVEASRIGRLFPDSPRVEGLRHRVEQARAMYKADLERRFLTEAENERVDEAMALLKELDAYLSETEAAPFREAARGVIAKARDNLGARFKLAIQDRQWAVAAELGQRIVDEFPNSRMADEVRPLIEGLRTRAREATPAR